MEDVNVKAKSKNTKIKRIKIRVIPKKTSTKKEETDYFQEYDKEK